MTTDVWAQPVQLCDSSEIPVKEHWLLLTKVVVAIVQKGNSQKLSECKLHLDAD